MTAHGEGAGAFDLLRTPCREKIVHRQGGEGKAVGIVEHDPLVVGVEHHNPVIIAVGGAGRPRLVREQADINRPHKHRSLFAGVPQPADGLLALTTAGTPTRQAKQSDGLIEPEVRVPAEG
ncbi:hypothetical protein [Streptomyces sp. ME19-01-6]|uniref:hypothetical protein n=1 Tax=Streptomyces sp. ME19-01-6 TaxID=3028686 RepID=UPI0029ABAC4D|nr:hypothetical protein [Streptomyces sp. ME19-01-6]MDX3224140.1 hypothetical protein [Streptomyces sp. ME19-01-6]